MRPVLQYYKNGGELPDFGIVVYCVDGKEVKRGTMREFDLDRRNANGRIPYCSGVYHQFTSRVQNDGSDDGIRTASEVRYIPCLILSFHANRTSPTKPPHLATNMQIAPPISTKENKIDEGRGDDSEVPMPIVLFYVSY
jgi:hypothetical protein